MANAQRAQNKFKDENNSFEKNFSFDNFNPDLVVFVKLTPHLENQSGILNCLETLFLRVWN